MGGLAQQVVEDGVLADADDALLEAVAKQLIEIHRKSGFERTCEIGRTILSTFYGNDETLWSARAPGKLNSIRKLAHRLKGTLRTTELHRSVHVWTLCRALPFVPKSEHLTVSHVDAVLGLPRERQAELLRASEEQRLSVRDVRQLRRRLKIASGEMRGRPPSPMVSKAATRIRNASTALESAIAAIRAADFSSDPVPQELFDLVDGVREQAANLAALLAGVRQPSGIHPRPVTAARRCEPIRVAG
jgi:hypothetical protein